MTKSAKQRWNNAMQGFCEWCNQEVPYGVEGRCYLGHPASALRKGTLTGTMPTIVEPPVSNAEFVTADAIDSVASVDRNTSELLAATLASALASPGAAPPAKAKRQEEATAAPGETPAEIHFAVPPEPPDGPTGDIVEFVIGGGTDPVAESVDERGPGIDAGSGVATDAATDAGLDAGLAAELSPETVFGVARPSAGIGADGIGVDEDDDADIGADGAIDVEQWSAIPIPDANIPVYEYRPPKRDEELDAFGAAPIELFESADPPNNADERNERPEPVAAGPDVHGPDAVVSDVVAAGIDESDDPPGPVDAIEDIGFSEAAVLSTGDLAPDDDATGELEEDDPVTSELAEDELDPGAAELSDFDVTDAELSDPETADLEVADLETADDEAADLEATDLTTSDLAEDDLEAADDELADLEAADGTAVESAVDDDADADEVDDDAVIAGESDGGADEHVGAKHEAADDETGDRERGSNKRLFVMLGVLAVVAVLAAIYAATVLA